MVVKITEGKSKQFRKHLKGWLYTLNRLSESWVKDYLDKMILNPSKKVMLGIL